MGLLAISACTSSVYTSADQNVNTKTQSTTTKASTNYIPVATTYSITSDSFQQIADVTSFETGFAHKWQLNGGDALSSYMKSTYMQSHFKSLQAGNNGQLKLVMTVNSYTFADHYATVMLHVVAYQNGKQILSKSYAGKGSSQTTKMWLEEGFGMKSAIQDSTNAAMTIALNGMLSDLSKVKSLK